MRFLMRTDASTELGAGHVMRCLALAHQLRDIGEVVEFACSDLPGNLIAYVVAQKFTVHTLPRFEAKDSMAHDLENIQEIASRVRVDWIVVDHYQLDHRWESPLRKMGCRVLVIDDLANRFHDCNLLLDQNFHADPWNRYRKLISRDCQLLLGPRFALLRQEFEKARSTRRQRDGVVRRALVSFGGSDYDGATLQVLQVLGQPAFDSLAVDIVVGPQNGNLGAIKAFCASRANWDLHIGSNAIAALMNDADLAIGGGGITTWERCCLGLPCVVLSIAENQHAGCLALANAGAIVYMGSAGDVAPTEITNTLQTLLRQPDRLRHLGHASLELVDGKGTRRVANALRAQLLEIRRAQLTDCDSIHAWRNTPEVRRYSGNTAEIPIESHREWFANKIASPICDLFVGSVENSPVGAIRFDISGNQAYVSIFLAPGQTGHGLGRSLLCTGMQRFFSERPSITRVLAKITPENIASQLAFLDAGFKKNTEYYEIENCA